MKQPYSTNFFAEQKIGAETSCRPIVTEILTLFKINSVVDVGCGLGVWLAEFARQGINDFLGIDGDYIDRQKLLIPQSHFQSANLEKLIKFDRNFDLACSLEVAEHLPESSAQSLVYALVSAAPVVLFSAAIPGQGGRNHLNEQYQSYWARLFAEHRYTAFDVIRPKIFCNSSIKFWYRQNILVFCDPSHHPIGVRPVTNEYELNRIFPEMLLGPRSSTQALRAIKQSVPILANAVIRQLGVRK